VFSADFSLQRTASTPKAKFLVQLVEHIHEKNQDVKSRRLAGLIEKTFHLEIENHIIFLKKKFKISII
jgi:hypothetical protein